MSQFDTSEHGQPASRQYVGFEALKIAGSAAAVIGSGVVEKAIKAMADFGVSGSVVQITP